MVEEGKYNKKRFSFVFFGVRITFNRNTQKQLDKLKKELREKHTNTHLQLTPKT